MTPKNFARLVKDYEKKHIAYNKDCNKRFLGRGKTDKKREALRKSAEASFERMISAARQYFGIHE